MPSSAFSSKDFLVRVATANGAVKNITAASAANPVVITSAAHGLANGAVVFVDGVVGMVELNGRAFVVANQAANTFELKGVDGTAYTPYASGGTATPKTMVEVANVKNVSLFEGTTPEITTTNLRSRRAEYIVDIPDSGNGSLTIDLASPADVGQERLRTLRGSTVAETFTAVLRDGRAAAFVAFVQSFPVNAGVGQAVGGQIALRITGEEAWFA